MTVILGLDVGEKKIGLAIGDTTTKLAFPRPALLVQDWSEAWEPIQTLVRENNVDQILIGLPLDTDGAVGAQAVRTQEFIEELRQRLSVDVITRDERFSSQAVQHEQRDAGRTLTRGQEDSLAAQLVLESYLQEQP